MQARTIPTANVRGATKCSIGSCQHVLCGNIREAEDVQPVEVRAMRKLHRISDRFLQQVFYACREPIVNRQLISLME